jgi:hypothetical protein
MKFIYLSENNQQINYTEKGCSEKIAAEGAEGNELYEGAKYDHAVYQ